MEEEWDAGNFSYCKPDPLAGKASASNGVYITLSSFGQEIYPGITNVGYKPTVGENFIGVESYLLTVKNLYGKTVL